MKSEGEPDTPTTPELPANLNLPTVPGNPGNKSGEESGVKKPQIPEHSTQHHSAQDEFHTDPASPE